MADRPLEKPIVVTGAAGFIGSHLVEALLARGATVIGIDNFDRFYDEGRKRRNIEAIRAHPRASAFQLVEADITDAEAMGRVFSGHRPAGVLHMAAKAGVRPSIADPVAYQRANVVGTGVLLACAGAAGCDRFVLASSSSVYGNSAAAPFREDERCDEPISPYAATKRACEVVAHAHHHLASMPTACLRFFTVYGPRQRPDLAIGAFLERVSRDETITMFGDGRSARDYTYIDDVIGGVLAAYQRIGDHGFRVWNLGNSSPVALRDMIATIGRVVGREPRIERRPMQAGDVELTCADLTRSGTELGYRPAVPFEEGVARQWRWMQGTP